MLIANGSILIFFINNNFLSAIYSMQKLEVKRYPSNRQVWLLEYKMKQVMLNIRVFAGDSLV